jgi:uncharacterized protein YaaW (UPF0174 family)
MALLRDLKKDPAKFCDVTDEDLVTAISAELRSAAGNSIANSVRDPHDFPYKQVLIDVADKLAPGRLSWTKFKLRGPETEEQIEDYINQRVRTLTERHLKSMPPGDRAKVQERLEADLRARGLPERVVQGSVSAVAAGTLTGVTVGPLVATTIFGGAWTWLVGMSLGQLALGGLLAGGPAGVLVAGALVIGGTSYSKTIPAVIRLIMIRLSHDAEVKLRNAQ